MRIPSTPIREEISRRLDNAEEVTGLEGIELITKRNPSIDRMRGFNCVKYCFSRDSPHFVPYKNHFLSLPIKYHTEVKLPEEGDFAIYISGSSRFGLEFEHIGTITAEGKVRSKWGRGNIYLHSIGSVPVEYGETVRFFRKSE
jgi:hypothetical protein